MQLSPVVKGGGSEVEVVGTAYFENGEEASYTQVKLIPVGYDAVSMESIPDSMLDTSDAHGRYSFRGVEPGSYNIQAVHLSERTRFLLTGIAVSDDTALPHQELFRTPARFAFCFRKQMSHPVTMLVFQEPISQSLQKAKTK